MLRIEWKAPKVTLQQFEEFLNPFLGSNYDGLLLENDYVYVRVNEQLTSEQEKTIVDWIDSQNQKPQQVVTQFELRDKTLKLARSEAACDEAGIATILIKVPGTPGSTDGRWILGGSAWFNGDWHSDDCILGVWFTDEDNILGYGPGVSVGSYTDDDLSAEQQGWFIPKNPSVVTVSALGGYGFCPAGLYIKIVGRKGGSSFTGIDLYVNMQWGKIE